MKKIYTKSLLGLLTFYAGSLCAESVAGALTKVGKSFIPTEVSTLFTTLTEERQRTLQSLEKERDELRNSQQEFIVLHKKSLDEVNTQIALTKDALKAEGADSAFLNKKLALLNDSYQVLSETQQARNQLLEVLEEYIKELKLYLEDSHFRHYKQKITQELVYTLEYLDTLNEKITMNEETLRSLADQEKNAHIELESRKVSMQASQDALKILKDEHAAATMNDTEHRESFGLMLKQKAELFALQEKYYAYKKQLDDLLLRHITYKVALVQLKVSVIKSRNKIVKDEFIRIKPIIRVTEAEARSSRDDLKEKQNKVSESLKKYDQNIRRIDEKLKTKEQELEALGKQYNEDPEKLVNDWQTLSTKTLASYTALADIGLLREQVSTLQRQREVLEVKKNLEKEKLFYETIKVLVKESFAKLATKKYGTSEQIDQEINDYVVQGNKATTSLANAKFKKAAITKVLEARKAALQNVMDRIEEVKKERDTLFKNSPREHARILEQLLYIEKKVIEQVELLGKLVIAYDDIIAVIGEVEKRIQFVTAELRAKKGFSRPETAISWEGFTSSISELTLFLTNVRTYVVDFNMKQFFFKLRETFAHRFGMLSLLIHLLVWGIILLLLYRYLPAMCAYFFALVADRRGWFAGATLLLASFLSFVYLHFYGLAVWFTLFWLLRILALLDPYPCVLFYLASIPYLLYIARQFMYHMVEINEDYGYPFVSKEYQERGVTVVSTLLYSTVAIQLLRAAFMLTDYYQSELPTILLTINIVILQISVIALLFAKELILNFIPDRSDWWEWVREQLENYYYLIVGVITIITVMSNPYVGFGSHVFYVLQRLLYSAIFLKLLLWLHAALKQASYKAFFYVDGDIVREQFASAKTWFGLYMISLFVLLSIVAVIFGINIWGAIWGWKITFTDIFNGLREPFMLKGTDAPLSVISLAKIVMSIIAGFGVSFAINRFVYSKIFDLLLVDAGVQNTVVSITRYIIIILAIAFGFYSVGLGTQVATVITILLVSVGWVLRDPISDFMAYFIILVQRPIKIGDYVRIDDQSKGVVRKITSRSVVLRRNNSTTIIMPNSEIMRKTLVNWNYTNGFIAFDDIMLTVRYDEDPEKVRDILFKVLDASPVVLKNPKPIVRLENFSDAGFTFLIRGHLSSSYTLQQWNIASDIRIAIVKEFRAQGIRFAFPVRIMYNHGQQMAQEDVSRENDHTPPTTN